MKSAGYLDSCTYEVQIEIFLNWAAFKSASGGLGKGCFGNRLGGCLGAIGVCQLATVSTGLTLFNNKAGLSELLIWDH